MRLLHTSAFKPTAHTPTATHLKPTEASCAGMQAQHRKGTKTNDSSLFIKERRRQEENTAYLAPQGVITVTSAEHNETQAIELLSLWWFHFPASRLNK